VFARFLKFGDGPTDAVLVNNDEWLGQLSILPFLRDYGRYFTINRMLTFESVKQRLGREQPLTFLEFNYMIFQAYDFLELSRRCVSPELPARPTERRHSQSAAAAIQLAARPSAPHARSSAERATQLQLGQARHTAAARPNAPHSCS
jgi:hypothetical protein